MSRDELSRAWHGSQTVNLVKILREGTWALQTCHNNHITEPLEKETMFQLLSSTLRLSCIKFTNENKLGWGMERFVVPKCQDNVVDSNKFANSEYII